MQNNANDIWTKLYPPVCKYSWQHKRGANMSLNHTHAASPTRQRIGVGPFLSINKLKAHGKQHEKRRCFSTNPCCFYTLYSHLGLSISIMKMSWISPWPQVVPFQAFLSKGLPKLTMTSSPEENWCLATSAEINREALRGNRGSLP